MKRTTLIKPATAAALLMFAGQSQAALVTTSAPLGPSTVIDFQ